MARGANDADRAQDTTEQVQASATLIREGVLLAQSVSFRARESVDHPLHMHFARVPRVNVCLEQQDSTYNNDYGNDTLICNNAAGESYCKPVLQAGPRSICGSESGSRCSSGARAQYQPCQRRAGVLKPTLSSYIPCLASFADALDATVMTYAGQKSTDSIKLRGRCVLGQRLCSICMDDQET